MKFRPKFTATALAGIPHRDVEQACRLMKNHFPEVCAESHHSDRLSDFRFIRSGDSPTPPVVIAKYIGFPGMIYPSIKNGSTQ